MKYAGIDNISREWQGAGKIAITEVFNVQAKIIINKYGLNCSITKKIERWSRDKSIQVPGEIVFDKIVAESVVRAKTIVGYPDYQVIKILRNIWKLPGKELERKN
ncbi:MAG: hypothetical protein PHQ09_06645 [Actinomycetota bacterium]|nr:hypothetical protein [Actinomycetota bacterium]